ncbi:F-box/LRR-repeat protein 4-like [Amphiura filiformis]|uniref:F-box/LRR-repeat protein 4-like n=1 Tax=Amphiura filiformis TaxID=82378 RepID=UPI003B20C7C2
MLNSCCRCKRDTSGGMSSITTSYQFAKEVVHFSSQYGNDGSTAYVANNLAGPITVFPNYGDVTGACVFRTYGPWWEESPSAPKLFTRRTTKPFLGQDFIDVSFEKAVYPTAVKIYQNYHPGAIIEIYAREVITKNPINPSASNIRWHLIWSGPPQTFTEAKAVIHSAEFKGLSFKTDFIRLVLHHSHLDYYTELDSIELVGTNKQLDNGTDIDEAYINHLQKLSLQDDVSTKELVVDRDDDDAIPTAQTDNGYFDNLPGELVQLIFTYLEIIDLSTAAATCKLFKQYCYDALQFTELDFQPYWYQVRDRNLDGLSNRCSQLQKLSLSWCGDWGMISTQAFSRFTSKCGTRLQCLRLSSCRFLTVESFQTIAQKCTQLQELDLSSCRFIPTVAFEHISQLKELTSLNLYRTTISEPATIDIIRACSKLEHLNLGNVKTIQSYDNIVRELATHCRNLKSVNLWRAKTLTHVGLGVLSHGCLHLVELDLGWCSELNSSTTCFVSLVQSCRKLKKLILTAIRSVSDNDLYAFASCCPDMEQIDILGTMQVGPQSVGRVLECCKKLRFFDLSFCNRVPNEMILTWREAYPQVSIKRSFTQASF